MRAREHTHSLGPRVLSGASRKLCLESGIQGLEAKVASLQLTRFVFDEARMPRNCSFLSIKSGGGGGTTQGLPERSLVKIK